MLKQPLKKTKVGSKHSTAIKPTRKHAKKAIKATTTPTTTQQQHLHTTNATTISQQVRLNNNNAKKPLKMTKRSVFSIASVVSTETDTPQQEQQLNNNISISNITSTPQDSNFTEPHVNPTYITNPIFYVNGQPHIGHLYTSLLSDTIKSWKRSQGNDTFIMGGTDEHGIKVQEASEKAGYSDPLAFCDKISADFEVAWEKFHLTPDAFLRTTDPEHEKSVQWMWKQLARNGYIYLGKHEGWYCKSDEVFVPQAQLIKHDDGRLTTASGHEVVWLEEENFKFRLSAFLQPLLQFYDKVPSTIYPYSQLKQLFAQTDGLEDISISRLASKLKWSTNVPSGDDFEYWVESEQRYKKPSEVTTEQHKVYVWLDALNIYITAARHATNLIRKGKGLPPGEVEGAEHVNQGADRVISIDLPSTPQPPPSSTLTPLDSATTPSDQSEPITPKEKHVNNRNGAQEFNLTNNAPFTQHLTINHPKSFYATQDWYQSHPRQLENQHYADRYQDLMSPVWPPSMHVIGKDILKFHAIYWPAFLIGSGLPIPQQIVSHSHWLVNGQKMSKSLGNVVSPHDLETLLGVENTKYALMRLGLIGEDSDFILTHAISTINAELSDTIGNLAMRCTGKTVLPDSKYPDPLGAYRQVEEIHDEKTGHVKKTVKINSQQALADGIIGQEEMQLENDMNQLRSMFDEQMGQLRIDRALQAIMDVGRNANAYFSLYEPWKLAKVLKDENVSPEEKAKIQQKMDVVLYYSIEAARLCSIMLRIVVPQSADIILDQISFPKTNRHLVPNPTFGWHPSLEVNKDPTGSSDDVTFCHVANVPFSKIKPPTVEKPKGNKSGKNKEKDNKKEKEPKKAKSEQTTTTTPATAETTSP